jgi:ribosome-associated translation inhibitor RaiA
MEVDLSKEHHHQKGKDAFKAEFKVYCRGEYLQSAAEAEDIYSAIDLARDEAYMILSSKKDKKMTLWRRGGKKLKNLMRGMTFRKGGDDLDM